MAEAATGKKKILIVEDEEVIANICRTVLVNEGFNVDIAVDCRIAQKMINQNHYDLCLLDILIPKMSGRQLYQWLLRKHPQTAEKVIFCTGLAIEGNIKKFLEKSGCPLLLKPFSPDELTGIIQEALRWQNGREIDGNTDR
ncbi:MAG TPA: response regulator [Dehalococcoidia bacterium]|nr:response regulator [Dehalococcoidia bacterium]